MGIKNLTSELNLSEEKKTKENFGIVCFSFVSKTLPNNEVVQPEITLYSLSDIYIPLLLNF